MSLKIVELMRKPPAQRDLPWLQQALQSAIELELSTLPPYLCGLWALQDQNSDAAGLILSIALDEMSHLGLACNMLRATGVQPQIFAGYDQIQFPGHLPGGVRPKCDPSFFPCDKDFQVVLGFSDFHAFAKMCMQIEYPEDPVPRPTLFAAEETFPSIGEFYDAVLKAFEALPSTFQYGTAKQLVNGSPKVFVIDSLANAKLAITTIQQQGEGASRNPFASPNHLAHFYAFGEIYFGKTYVFDPDKKVGDWTGDPITIPAVFPMTPVPLKGYPNPPQEVTQCDQDFTTMLQQLDNAWANGDANMLSDAVGTMFSLSSDAQSLMSKQIKRTDASGVYGPQFRKVAAH